MINKIEELLNIDKFRKNNSKLKLEEQLDLIDPLLDFDFIADKNSNNSYLLDYLPLKALDFNKYKYLEICYDFVLSNKISLKKFTDCENKIKNFLEKLWVANHLFIYTDLRYIECTKRIIKVLNDKEIKIFKEFYNKIKMEDKLFYILDDYELLNIIIKLSTRELIFSLLYFKEVKSVFWFDNLVLPCYLNESSIDLIEKISTIEGLYLRKKD